MSRYATPADLYKYGAPAATFSTVPFSDLQDFLDAVSDEVDSYLADHFTLPLLATPILITKKVCEVAAWELIVSRGYSPDPNDEEPIKLRWKAAREWLEKVGKGELSPTLQDSSAGGNVGSPTVLQAGAINSNPTTGGTPNPTTPTTRGW